MVQVVGQTDIAAMLAAFERSIFERLTVQVGPTRVTANRAPAATVAPASVGRARAAVAAPMVGIFRAGLDAKAEPLVRPGDAIDADTVIGTILVRRKVHPVRAGRPGTVAEVLVRDGDFVEYGQALLQTDAAAGDV